MLSLLADDVAHLPPEALERAIDHHVLTCPFMPKAADLIKLAQDHTDAVNLPRQPGQTYAEALAYRYNERCSRDDCEWAVDGNGSVYLRYKATSHA